MKTSLDVFNFKFIKPTMVENIMFNAYKRVSDLANATFGDNKVNFTFQDVIDDTMNGISELIEDDVFNRVQSELTYRRDKYKIFNRRKHEHIL